MAKSDPILKGPIPRTIKLTVGFFLVYAVLKGGVLGIFSPWQSGYQMRHLFILFWAPVLTWALLRRDKHAWKFSVYVVGGYLLVETMEYMRYFPRFSSGEFFLRANIVFVVSIVLLLASLAALAMPASREPFRLLAEARNERT